MLEKPPSASATPIRRHNPGAFRAIERRRSMNDAPPLECADLPNAALSKLQLGRLCCRHDRDLLEIDALRQAHRERDGLSHVFGFEPFDL